MPAPLSLTSLLITIIHEPIHFYYSHILPTQGCFFLFFFKWVIIHLLKNNNFHCQVTYWSRRIATTTAWSTDKVKHLCKHIQVVSVAVWVVVGLSHLCTPPNNVMMPPSHYLTSNLFLHCPQPPVLLLQQQKSIIVALMLIFFFCFSDV